MLVWVRVDNTLLFVLVRAPKPNKSCGQSAALRDFQSKPSKNRRHSSILHSVELFLIGGVKQKVFQTKERSEKKAKMQNQKNRWWLAPCLVLTLGLTPAAFAQEKKSEGMMEGEHMMEQKGDAMKSKGAMKDTGAMKDHGAMKDNGSMKDTGAMKDQGDKMEKQ